MSEKNKYFNDELEDSGKKSEVRKSEPAPIPQLVSSPQEMKGQAFGLQP
jgi:hypothetical protein